MLNNFIEVGIFGLNAALKVGGVCLFFCFKALGDQIILREIEVDNLVATLTTFLMSRGRMFVSGLRGDSSIQLKKKLWYARGGKFGAVDAQAAIKQSALRHLKMICLQIKLD